MKSVLFSVFALVAALHTLAAPTHPPPVDYESIDYPTLHEYPAPEGGWESVDYPFGKEKKMSVFEFTSEYYVKATGAQVINGTTPTPGPKDALGLFYYGINAPEDTICWNITLLNVVGEYRSPARTATHIHEGLRGASGPPRIVFPNPVGDDKLRRSVGCMVGPFTTGINATGTTQDTGTGFMVAQIEANPAGFFTDAHTVLFVPGVVRGQLD